MKTLARLAFLLPVLVLCFAQCNNANADADSKTEISKKKEKFTGLRKSYYDEAEKIIMSEVGYIEGVRNGKAIDYYKDGKVRLQGHHSMGEKDGTFIWFFENGKKFKEIGYKKGTPHGWDSAFYESGYHKHAVLFDNGFLQEGTMEWSRRHEVIALPKTIVTEENRIALDGEYLFFASFDQKVEDPIFEIGVIGNGSKTNPEVKFETMMFLDQSETKALYKTRVLDGYEYVAKAVIKARGKTKLGNPFVTYKVFPVVMR